eukprot:GILJ01015069.1.p1 GENE.GILJ01015069.1~~GILJ01015069.1.p1  ORF type:complete len:221 (+),score=47.72 GILJ01015069.1:87-665(+)
MKIKEIKAWMQEYGLACSDCSDKDSLVQFCIKNAKATPKAVRPKVPAGKTFWDAWADNAKEICDAQVAKTGAGEEGAKVCDAIRLATDSFFLQKGKQVAGKLKKKPEALLKTSYSEIYYDATRRIITRLTKHCLSSGNIKSCQSSSAVQTLMEKEKVAGAPFVMYMTNIGIENTNPMYDILKDKQGLDHDEL